MTILNEPFLLEPEGATTACLLLHGLGGGAYELRPLGEALAKQGLAAQGILYPGHDQRRYWMPASTWLEWYAHAEVTLQGLMHRYKTIHLVGFSTGCPLALRLALHYSLGALVLLAPFVSIRRPRFAPVSIDWLAQSLGRVIPNMPRLALAIRDREQLALAEAQSFFQSFNMVAVRSALDLIQSNQPHLGGIHNPTLLIQSPADTVVAPWGAQYLYDHLGSTEKRLVWLQKSDHIITLDTERQTVETEVLAFLTAHS